MSKPRNGSEQDRIIREIIFKEELYKVNPNLEITGKYINAQTMVEFKCNRCGEEHQYANPRSLLKLLSKCSRCDSERKITVGYNDFATTHPQYLKLFKDKSDATKTTYGSGKKIEMICPICKYEKKISARELLKNGFACPRCSDKTSYPNKFMFNLLHLLNINFDNEVMFDWSQNRRYDFMVGNNLIEMDGGFHKGSTYMSYDKCKEIDDLKDRLAIENGYKIIRIECYKSEFEYIKNNILNSDIIKILNLYNFNWVELEKQLITNNFVKIASDIFNRYKGIKNISEMAKIMNINTTKFVAYLKHQKDWA